MHSVWILIFAGLFFTGLTGLLFLKDRNILIILMSLELIFFSLGLGFIYFSWAYCDFKGYIYALILLALAAAEAAVGLSITMLAFKRTGTINLKEFVNVKF